MGYEIHYKYGTGVGIFTTYVKEKSDALIQFFNWMKVENRKVYVTSVTPFT